MKKIGILLCAVCCMLYSCASAPHSDDSRSETSVNATESIAESDSAEPADLSAVKTISELVRYMYQVAQAPEKNLEDSDKPMAPGDVMPVECLPRVAPGVIGQEVCLSLIPDKNDVFLRVYSAETGTSVAIVTANGSDGAHFSPMLLVLSIPDSSGAELFEQVTELRGTVQSVCFLDGNEYYFVLNSFTLLMETEQDGSVTDRDTYGVIRADGTVRVSFGEDSEAVQTIDRVYGRILTRFGVEVPS